MKLNFKLFLKNNMCKLLYIIEFITSFFIALISLRIFSTKHYYDFWSLKYLLIIMLVILAFLISVIINLFLNKKKLENIWMIFLIPIGMLFLVYIIPTHVPDENAHLWKAYELSRGKIVTKVNKDGSYPTEIPEFYKENDYHNLTNYGQMFEKINHNTDYGKLVQVTNPASSYFSPLYIFSALGLFIGRILKINGIYAEYLSRLFNYSVFLILSYYSIKKIPFGKMALGVLLFFPMILQQGTSMSIDCLINALSIFYISYTLYLRFEAKQIKRKEKIIYCIISCIIGIAKYVYLPICCLSLLLISNKNLNKKDKLIIIIGTIIIPLIVAVGWFMFSKRYVDTRDYLNENNVDFGKQVNFIINNPLHFFRIISNNAITGFESWLYCAVGFGLGWLNIFLPYIKITIFLILYVLAIYFENNRFQLNKVECIFIFLITLGVYFLTIIALYLIWSGVGSEEVKGVQGRYFVPILILPILCMARKENYVKLDNIQYILPLVLIFIDFSVIKVIFNFFL